MLKTLADFPHLVDQWHPTLNAASLRPVDVSAGSRTSIWWQCPNGPDHVWPAPAYARTNRSKPTGCPFCQHQRLSQTNSLAAMHPALVAQWHPTKNGDLSPNDVIAGTKMKVWWKCPHGPDHEWPATVINRTFHGRGCPCCVGKQLSVTNNLAAKYPNVAAQWHPRKNGNLTPEQITAGSGQRVWWKCPAGPDHEWESKVLNRTSGGKGCPFCAGKRKSIADRILLEQSASGKRPRTAEERKRHQADSQYLESLRKPAT